MLRDIQLKFGTHILTDEKKIVEVSNINSSIVDHCYFCMTMTNDGSLLLMHDNAWSLLFLHDNGGSLLLLRDNDASGVYSKILPNGYSKL